MRPWALKGRRSQWVKKVISLVVILAFTSLQILPQGWSQSVAPEFELQNQLPEKAPLQTTTNESIAQEQAPDSIAFLQDDSPLKAVTSDQKAETAQVEGIKEEQSIYSNQAYEYERYDFEQAFDSLRPEYASAVVVEHLAEKDLEALSKLSFEVGIVILHGELVLFSSGGDGEILVSNQAQEILQQSCFTAHTHPLSHEAEGPSPLDIAQASEALEYVVSGNQMFVYNHDGNIQEISYGEFLQVLDETLGNEREDHGQDPVKAREVLNRFIREMDLLNEKDDDQRIETFRTAGTVIPTAGLTSSSLTSFTGSPWVLLMTGSSNPTNLAQSSSSQFQLNYDITISGSKSGAYVSFDNPTTTTTVEVGDLSSLTQLTIGVSGPAGSKVRFEVEDSLGAKSEVTLINVSTAMQYYQISKTLFTGLDWTKIKRFIYSVDSTLTSTLTGTLTIQTKTLLYSGTALTNLPNSPYIAIVPGSNPQTSLVESDSFVFKMNYDVSGPGSFSGGSVVLDSPYTSAVETGNLSSQTQFTFGLTGPSGGKVKLEFEDSLGVKSSVILTNLQSYVQYYMVGKNQFSGLDWTKIKRVNFIVDSTMVSPAQSSIVIYAKTLTFNNSVLLTPLPGNPRPDILEGSTSATKVRTHSNSSLSLDFSLPSTGTMSGAAVSFDDPSTSAIETQNLSTQSQFVFIASGIMGGKVRVELEDLLGNKAAGFISGLNSGWSQSFVLSKDLFSSVDLTKVKRIIFSVDKTLITDVTGTLNLSVKTLLYSSALATTFPGTAPGAIALEGSSSTTTVTKPSATQLRLNYNVTTAGTFSGASLSFDDLSTTGIETRDLSLGSTLTFGLQGGISNLTKVKVEIEDFTGAKSSVLLTGLYTGNPYYQIQKSSFTGVDLTKVKRLNFIIDQSMITASAGYQSWLQVTLNNFQLASTPTVAAPTVNSLSQYTTASSVTLSGTKSANTSIWISGVERVALNASTSWSYVATLVEGLNSFLVTAKDSVGAQSSAVSVSTTRDTVIPTGSININSSATYTNSTSVTLNLSAADGTGSGINTMSFSNDNTNWTTSEAYATSKAFTLPAGDGSKTVYAKYYDKAGNVSQVYSKAITLDTAAPTGTIKINNDAQYATSTSVTLNLTGTDATSGLDQMRFSTDGGTNWSTWEVFGATKSITLPIGDGTKTVQYELKDKSGLSSTILSDTIVLDTAPPSGSIQVNGGTQYITQTTVTLNLSAADTGSGLNQMSFSTDNVTYSTPEAYSTTKSWTFSSGDGNKTVYVKFSDQSGQWSSPVSVTVLLDTLIPTGSITINSGATYTNSTSVTLNLSAADGTGSGINTMSFSTDNVSYSVQEAYAVSKTYTLPTGDGSKTVYVKYFDKAGNVSNVYSKAITLDTIIPAGSININSGATYANSATVTLNLSASDALSGINTMSFSTDNVTYSTPEAYASTKSYALPTGDGSKTVYVKYFDKAGNVSSVYSKLITLDTIIPTGAVLINNGDSSTSSTNVTLILTAADSTSGVDQMRFSTDSGVTWTAWEVFAATKSLTLPSGSGTKTVQYQVKDKAGNISLTASDTIELQSAVMTFSDDFNRTTIGSNWNLDLGAWSILNNELYHAPGSPDPRGIATLSAPLSSNDYDISASVYFINASRDRNGLVARFSDLNNYYYAEYNLFSGSSAQFYINKIQNGAFTTIASISGFGIALGFNTLRLRVVGSNIKMFVNGVLKAEANDTALSSGRVGFQSMENAIRVDNFVANVVANVVPPTANTLPQYTTSSSVSLSGTKPANTSIWINGVERVALNSSTAWSYAQVLSEGTNSLSISAKDTTGNESSAVLRSITRDTILPTGSININSGSLYTTLASVTLNLSATDSGSGMDKMSFSTDGITYTAGEVYATTKTYTLPTGDGSKAVYVKYYDKAGNVSAVYLKSITLDTVFPNITGVASNSVTSSGATVTWITDEASDTQIEYGTTTSYGSSTILDASLVTNHSQALTSLQASTLYHYRVKSKDQAGNLKISTDFTFTTPVAPDTTPPVISLVASSNVTSSQATITWTTNEASDTQIEYGTTTAYGSTSMLNTQVTTTHSQVLSSLQSSALYHYRVKSRDAAGNLQTSGDFTFTTSYQTNAEVGLTGYWNFDTVTANTVSDLSGTGNTGTLVNGVLPSTDHPNTNFSNTGSLSFDGVNDYVQIPNQSSLNFGSGDFTISLWIRPDTVTLAKQAIMDKTDGTNGYRLITSDTDGDRLKFIRGAFFADGIQSNDAVLTVGAWQHVAVAISNNQVTFYVNGVNAGGASLPANGRSATTATNLFLGQKGYSGSSVNFFDGNMDEPRIYNRALSQAEVQNLAQGNLYSTTPPVVLFTSPASTTSANYTLTYTVDGVATSESWKLNPGANQLLVKASVQGKPPAFQKYTVSLTQTEPTVPLMPSIPTLAQNLVSVTTQDGLILKYDQGTLVQIEKLGDYQLYLPTLDTNNNLTGGLLQFSSGDKLLYQNSVHIYQISLTGDKTYYYPDGTVRAFETSTGQKTRFAYRLDSQGKVTGILTLEDTGASLYEASGLAVWVSMTDGTDIRYENGMLKQYVDNSGNRYEYVITQAVTNGILSGYRSELTWVRPAGTITPISFTQIQSQLASYPTIKQTLEQKLAKLVNYDAQGKITEFDSGLGEVLMIQNQLPISLRDKVGNLTLIGTQVSTNGTVESIALDETANPDQTFDSEGNLKSIRLSDGSVLQVNLLKVNEIVTSDGSILSSLVWNGSSLTGFIRTKLDGTKEIYQNSALIRREEANGVITNYVRLGGIDQPDTITTADGRTYKFIEYRNELGLNERLSELKSMDLPDGSRIEFENGKPIRYIQHKEVTLDPYEVPVLPTGESYVPSLQLSDAELRSVTIDSNATILSGEILFRDGTQYFIKDGVLLKQVTPDGRVLETLNQSLPPFVKPAPILPDALSASEVTYRNQAVDSQLAFFVNGIGIEPNSGMPLDNYKGVTSAPSDYSQATLVGFWSEILSAIARNDYTTTKITQLQAFQKLSALLTEFQKVQSQAGWNGMVAFFKIERVQEPILDSFGNPTGTYQWVNKYTRQFDTVGLGDNLNLSLSLATVIGALSGISLSSTLNTYRNQIITAANQILTAQDQGYSRFFDPTTNRFRMGYQFITPTTGQFVGYMDRVFNEFRPGLVWLASRNASYKVAVDNLDVTVRPYVTADGKQIDNAVPFDGNAFQMFWPLIHVDETKYAEFDVALKNFLYTQSEYVSLNGVPGLLSAGDSIGGGYNGKMGIPLAAETDDPLQTNVGSLYGTASAFPLAPHYTLQFLKNLETLFPGIKTTKGYVDALKLGTPTVVNGNTVQNPIYSQDFYGVDQASFILSLLNKSQSYFSNYLASSGLANGFDSLYKGMSFNLNPVAVKNPVPPSFGSTIAALYTGTNQIPDGRSNDLIKQPAFISTLIDSDLGEGHLFNYLGPDGKFHHTEIEFGEGASLRRMNLGEYLLLPGRADTAKSLLEGFTLDFLNRATSQGAFYTENNGYANAVLTTDPQIGEVRHVEFDLKAVTAPVGLWAQYSPTLDLSKYDFLSIPVRLGPDAPNGVGIKIELKGLGEVFVTGPLGRDWQFFQIPVAKPTGLLTEIAISIHNPNGPAAGDIYLGPLSSFKVRTSSQIDWVTTLGKTDTEMRNLLRSKVMSQSGGGGLVQADQILRNFTIDSDGKLVDGILDLPNGSTQYFKRGKLTKWVFRNGRTVLFENGLASFIMDLAHGTLEEGRFYYDQSFNGDIRSFIVQDNFGKRVFGSDGLLQTMVLAGQIINFKNGLIDSIITPTGTLTNLIFADDQSLIKAHVRLNDGREFDIDQTGVQVVDKGNGVKVHYLGSRITAIETLQNGRTDFTYRTDATGEITGVDAIFNETVIDPITLVSSVFTRTISLFEYIRRPERTLEKAEIVTTASLIPISSIGGFSTPGAPLSGEITHGLPEGGYLIGSSTPCTSPACYRFKYNSTTGPILGVSFTHTQTATLSDFDFLLITLAQDPAMTWNEDFNVKLKSEIGPNQYNTLYTFLMSNVPAQSKTYEFSLAGKSGTEGQITLEAVRESAGVSQTGTIYVQDISYASVKTLDHPIWEDETGLSRSASQSIKIESGILTQVGREIATGTPLKYSELIPFLDLPTRMIYTDLSVSNLNQLVNFKRFDGAEVTLSGQNVTKVILPDGTVNEYLQTGNIAQGVVRDEATGSSESGLQYQYGALRKTTQPDGRELSFSYEFDTDGKEITVVKDSVTGDTRRFKEGKLISSATTDQLETRFGYEAGELASSELLYKNRVLDSTRYHFVGDETQVTDERGTTWYYDANGNLIKHLTKDGYLFEYVDYSQSLGSQVFINPTDYKNTIFTATDLKAVRLKGYESSDGSQLIFNDEELGEVKLVNGDQAVNLDFDSLGRIRTGQIQLSTGIVISIEDYLPVSGRRSDGSVFTISFPLSSSREILFRADGSFDSFRVELNGKVYYYDIEGKLIKATFPESKTYDFTYLRNLSGVITGYQVLESSPILFRGVPYPKAVTLKSEGSGTTRKLSFVDGATQLASRTGSGFVASVFNEAGGTWDTLTGTFSSSADRFALKSFLTGVKQGDYVAVLISDSALATAGTTTERNEIFTLLESMGSGKIREAATTNKDWSFFGMKGLSLGEGVEELKTLGSIGTSSSVKQVQTTNSVTPGVMFDSVPVFLNTPVFELNAFIGFLSRFKNYQPDYEVQALSVYNSKDELVYSERLDGVRTYYENGNARETFDESGELLYVYEYDSEGRQKAIQIIKAEADFNEKMAEIRAKIEEEKFNALYQLAWRNEAARLQIKEEVEAGLRAIDDGISQLEGQRFQDVKVCKSKLVFFKSCHWERVEIPQVVSAINNLQSEKANLLQTQERELAKIGAEIESKRLEVETASTDQMAQLDQEEKNFKENVIHQEMDPIVINFYRDILGRDPSTAEIDQWINTYRAAGVIDTVTLSQTLTALAERTSALNQKQSIITALESFLTNYLAQTTDAGRQTLLTQIGLNLSETVSLDQVEVKEILDWLKARDLHFGQSAFLSLKEMLASRGKVVAVDVIAKESILIDILTGTINKFTEGELLISVFALSRTAKIHGETFSGVKYSFDDLKALYRSVCPVVTDPCSLRVIAHIGEDHFVVVTQVTDTEVSYRETTKGITGEEQTVLAGEFLKVWEGYLIVADQYAIPSKKISDQEAQQIRGAFFWLIFLAIAAIIAKVAAVVYAIVAFVVNVVMAVVAAVLNTVVNAISFVFTKIAEGVALIGKGFFNLSKLLYQGIKFTGRFLMKGFQFLKEGFTKGLERLGSGISKLKNFLLKATGKPIVNELGHNLYDANGNILRYFSFQQEVARNLVQATINYGVSKGLEGLGLNPTLAGLAGGFIGAGFLGAGAGLGGFIKSGLQNLLLQGVSILGLKLNLPPPITGAISLVTGTALQSYFDGSLTLKTFTDIAPKVASKLVLGGTELLGRSLGLNPQIAQLIGLPISAVVGGLVGNLVNPSGGGGPGGIWTSLRDTILTKAVEMGSDALFDALNLPSVVQQFGLSLFSSLAGNLLNASWNTGGTNSNESVFSRIFGNVAKFGQKIISGIGQIVSFGTKVVEGFGNLTKAGFAKAVDFFSGIFNPETREALSRAGNGSIENAIFSNGTVIGSGFATATVNFGGRNIVVDWDSTGGELKIRDNNELWSFKDPKIEQSHSQFLFGRLAYAEEYQDFSLIQEFNENSVDNIIIRGIGGDILSFRGFDNVPLRYDNLGSILSGELNLSNIASIRLIDGQIDEIDSAGGSGGLSSLIEQAAGLIAKPIGYIFTAAERAVLTSFEVVKGIFNGLGGALDSFYGTIIGRNAKDLWTPQTVQSQLGVPTTYTAADIAESERASGKMISMTLSDNSVVTGRIFRASDWRDYKGMLPLAVQERLNTDAAFQEYLRKETGVIFFGDTTKLADHYVEQFNTPNLVRREILGNGEHNFIKRSWFGEAQDLINDSLGQPGDGLAEIRIDNIHLTDIYRSTTGFTLIHQDAGANAFLSGINYHIFAEVLPSKFKRKK